MNAIRLVPHVVRAFHLGRQEWVWANWPQPTLDIAAIPCWPDLLAEDCRKAEGRVPPTEEWWGYLDLIPERAFSGVN